MSQAAQTTPALLLALVDMVAGDLEQSGPAPRLRAVDDPLEPAQREKCIKWLYDMLSILDTKTNQLLTGNSFILAASSFLAGSASTWVRGSKIWFAVPLVVSLVSLLFAAWRIFRIRWCFLEYMHRSTDDRGQPLSSNARFWREARALAREADERTMFMRRVRRLTLIGISLFVVAVLIALLTPAPPLHGATGPSHSASVKGKQA